MDQGTPQKSLTRRTVVKSAAWATPAVIVATALPAHAASTPPREGLNGWVTIGKNCPTLTINGKGNFNGCGNTSSRGIWTFNTSNAVITATKIVFWFNDANITFTNSSGAGWSNLVRDTSVTKPSSIPNGFYAYSTTYNGTWTYNTPCEAWVADGQPHWTANLGSNCWNRASQVYAVRSITFHRGDPSQSKTIEFQRGPVSLGGFFFSNDNDEPDVSREEATTERSIDSQDDAADETTFGLDSNGGPDEYGGEEGESAVVDQI